MRLNVHTEFSFKLIHLKVSLFFLFLAIDTLQAQTENSLKDFNKKLLKAEQEISEGIDDLAERLDLFLSGKKVSTKKNETTLRVVAFAELFEGGELRSNLAPDFSLNLPNLEESWQLKLSSTDSDDFNSLDRRRFGVAPGARRYGAAVGLMKQLGHFQTVFQPRLIFSDPFQTYYLLQLTSKAKVKKVTLRPELRFFADSEKGTGQSAALYLDFHLTPRLIFRFINEEQYLDLQNLFSTNFGPELLYRYSPRTGMSTSLTFYSISRPVYFLEHYVFYLSLRHELYKQIFFFQLSPSLKFEKAYEFKGRAGIAVTLEVLF